MRILFYLPVVTPWWFEHIVAPLVRLCAREAEVHVVVCEPWSGTGLTAEQLGLLEAAPNVTWHLLGGDAHPQLRPAGAGHVSSELLADLLELVRQIEPHICLCRSANEDVPLQFPGVVRFLMEGSAAPYPADPRAIVFEENAFGFGTMPSLEDDERAELRRLFGPVAARVRAQTEALPRFDWRAEAGIDRDRKVLVVPLEYEHEENFAPRAHRTNYEWIEQLAAELDPELFLAVTNHPLNELYVDNTRVEALLESLAGRAVLAGRAFSQAKTTSSLVADSDGAILDLSKAFGLFAYHGKPFARVSSRPTAPWLHAARDVRAFGRSVLAGTAAPPERAAAEDWFAFRIANDMLDPNQPGLEFDELVDRVFEPKNPERWAIGVERYAEYLG